MHDADCQLCDSVVIHVAEQAEPAARIKRVTCPICGAPNIATRHIIEATCGTGYTVGEARYQDTPDAVHPTPTRLPTAISAALQRIAADTDAAARRSLPRKYTRDEARAHVRRQLEHTTPAPSTHTPDDYHAEMTHQRRQLRHLEASLWERDMLAAGITPDEIRRINPPAPCWCTHTPTDHSTTPGTGCTHRGCLCLDTPTTAGPIPTTPITFTVPDQPAGVRAFTTWWRRILTGNTDA